MDTESGTKGKILSFVKKSDPTSCEAFLTEILATLRAQGAENQPHKLMVIEYIETENESSYNLYIGGPGEMRPHHLVGILYCLADNVAGSH